MLKADSPSKESSSIDSNKCMFSNSNNTTTTELTPQKKDNLVDCLHFFQQNFINSDLVELLDLTRNKQMNENAFIGFSTPNTEKENSRTRKRTTKRREEKAKGGDDD